MMPQFKPFAWLDFPGPFRSVSISPLEPAPFMKLPDLTPPDPYPDVDRVSRSMLEIHRSLPDPPPPLLRHREPDAFETISAMLEKNKIQYREERAYADGIMDGLTRFGRYRP